MIYWFTGQPCAGKTTLAKKLHRIKPNAFMIDGDDLRDLTINKDPRILGYGDLFDNYTYAEKRTRNFYERYMNGESLDSDWVNSSDFENPPD